nr:EAL domain-containing protein [Propionivibrio soli]
MWESINTRGYWKGELWNRCKNGDVRPKSFSISVVRNDDGEIVNHLAIFSDITDRKLAEERIEFLSHHDALTRLPNRILTRDRFEQAVAKTQREQTGIGVLFVDLDNFKYVNDSFGHQAGNRLLVTSVGRLKQFIRETDTISRQGGDEFVIILPDIKESAAVERVASQILVNLAWPFEIEGYSIGISASVGISFYPAHGRDFDALLQNAEAAMYAAKAAGKNGYRVFSEEMNADALDKLKLKAMLRLAIDKREFYLVYQPQFDLSTQRLIGVEALIRWHHPEEGVIPPGRFIPVAEESGMIGEIGEWVINEACRQGREWFDAGIGPFVVAVNVSTQQFVNGAILRTVKRVLERTGFPPQFLELEFTESGLLSDIRNSLTTIEAVRALGVKTSIDDFGTGYSSLSYLQQFKVERLKIDQSFIRAIGANAEGMEIVRAIIQLGKTLRLSVIAEGVETELHLQTLKKLGCDEAQGYLFSRPLTVPDLMKFINEGKGASLL